MYIKRLAEMLVQKAFLIFEILSFEVYCRSIATLRLTDTGSHFSNMPENCLIHSTKDKEKNKINGDGRQTMHKSMNNYI